MDEGIVSKRLYEHMHRLYLTFILKDNTQEALKIKLTLYLMNKKSLTYF